MKYLIFVLTMLFSSFLTAGTIDPKVPAQKYLDYAKGFPCVLQIRGTYKESNFQGSCVVIDPYHVLTAAHVVADSTSQFIIHNGKEYPCDIVAINANYNADKMSHHDIALCGLVKPIKLSFYPELYEDRDEVGKVCSMAGYGFTGDFTNGYNIKYDNKRRAGSNIIDSIDNNVLEYSVHKSPSTTLEFLICSGDSGGGLFIGKKLAGIHSCVYATDRKTDSDYGDVGCSTRVSDYIEWIKKTKQIIKEIREVDNAKKGL